MYTGLCKCMCINTFFCLYKCACLSENIYIPAHSRLIVPFCLLCSAGLCGCSYKRPLMHLQTYLTHFLPSLFTVRRLLQTHSKVLVQMVRCIIMPGKCEQLLFIAEQMLTAWKWYIANGMVDCLFSLMTEETSVGQGIYAGET